MKSSSALPIAIAIAFILATVTASCSCGTQATITVPATTSFPTTFEITAADNYTCRSSKGIGYYASGILYAGYSSTGSLTGDDYLAVTSFTPSNYAPSTATNVNACSNNIWTTNTSTSSTSVGYTIVCNNKYEDCDICTSYTPFCSRLPPSTSCCYDNHGANDLNSDYVKCTDGTTSGFSVVGSTWWKSYFQLRLKYRYNYCDHNSVLDNINSVLDNINSVLDNINSVLDNSNSGKRWDKQ